LAHDMNQARVRRAAKAASALLLLLPVGTALADVRSHTRPRSSGTAVSQGQASMLNLSLTDVAVRPIQSWLRASARPEPGLRSVTILIRSDEAALIKPGQRIRCFSVATRSQMHQGRVTGVSMNGALATVRASIADELPADTPRFLVEIVTDRGDYLSVPNVSIIEEEDRQLVYVQRGGRYLPVEVETGLRGELYTEISSGVKAGDQVVSIGSFFVDAENKLRSPSGSTGAMGGMDHGSMPGMNHGAMPGMEHGK